MTRPTLVSLHATAGALALLTICGFWLTALACELALAEPAIRAARTAILYALPFLILFLAAAGGSGFRLGAGWRSAAVRTKARRMRMAAANGLLVLVPAAVFLGLRAGAGEIDSTFARVQAVELISGAINIALVGLNLRDGLRMRAARRARAA